MMPPIGTADKRKHREITELAMTLSVPEADTVRNLAAALFLAIVVGGCASVNLNSHIATNADEALSLASSEQEAVTAQEFLLRSAGHFQQQDDHIAARTLLQSEQFEPMASEALARRHTLLSMASAVDLDDQTWAQSLTTGMQPEYFLDFERSQIQEAAKLQAQTLEVAGRPLEAAYTLMSLVMNDPEADSQALHDRIWQTLNKVPVGQLRKERDQAIGYEVQGWIELAATLADSDINLDQKGRMIRNWQNEWPGHPAAAILPSDLSLIATLSEQQPEKIALALPLTGPLASAGRAIRDGFLAAYYNDENINRDKLDIIIADTSDQPFQDTYEELVAQERELIIGPLQKEKLAELSAMHTLPVPVLGLNYLQGDNRIPDGLFQFGLAPEDEARQIANRMATDGIQQALALVPEGSWGDRIVQSLSRHAEENDDRLLDIQRYFPEENLRAVTADLLGITVSRDRAIDVERTAGIDVEFEPRRRQDAQAIVMVAEPQVARQFNPLFAFYFGGDLPVYAPSSVYEGTADPSRDRDLNGVMFTDIPWILAEDIPLRSRAFQIYPDMSGPIHRLFAMGTDSWQLTKRLPFLRQVEGATLPGNTGRLEMSNEGVVSREQLWAQFVSGTPERLPSLEADTRPREILPAPDSRIQ